MNSNKQQLLQTTVHHFPINILTYFPPLSSSCSPALFGEKITNTSYTDENDPNVVINANLPDIERKIIRFPNNEFLCEEPSLDDKLIYDDLEAPFSVIASRGGCKFETKARNVLLYNSRLTCQFSVDEKSCIDTLIIFDNVESNALFQMQASDTHDLSSLKILGLLHETGILIINTIKILERGVSVNNSEKSPPHLTACCRAFTLECLSCASSQTYEEYCAENPTFAGCADIITLDKTISSSSSSSSSKTSSSKTSTSKYPTITFNAQASLFILTPVPWLLAAVAGLCLLLGGLFTLV